jgi:hypothetical protein
MYSLHGITRALNELDRMVDGVVVHLPVILVSV